MDATAAAARGVVCLLARAPSAPGKTRLTAGLSPARALGLRRAMLLDTLESALSTCLQVIVCYTPASARAEIEDTIAYVARTFESASRPPGRPEVSYVGHPFMGCQLVPQSTGDLGVRMHAAFVEAFALGFDRVALIGSDLPTLPPDHLTRAVQALDRVPVVIGPAEDGGYYLIGLREPRPALFDGVTWGSADVLAQTMAIAAGVGVTVDLLPAWHDVDAPDDLERVRASRARHTRVWLENRT